MIQKILELTGEYFYLEDGVKIESYNEKLILWDADIVLITNRRVLKHIVESRKRDGYTLEDTFRLLNALFDALQQENFSIHATDKGVLLIEHVEHNGAGVVAVLEIVIDDEETYHIKTAFFRAAGKVKKLLKIQKSP